MTEATATRCTAKLVKDLDEIKLQTDYGIAGEMKMAAQGRHSPGGRSIALR
jgi:hypothetical protein